LEEKPTGAFVGAGSLWPLTGTIGNIALELWLPPEFFCLLSKVAIIILGHFPPNFCRKISRIHTEKKIQTFCFFCFWHHQVAKKSPKQNSGFHI
jgi:hypothetical protein